MRGWKYWAFSAVSIFLVVPGLNGCSGGGGTPTPETSQVRGQVLDGHGEPVADALVSVRSVLVEGRTDVEGRFLLQVAAGSHRLTASKGGVVLSEVCFTAAEGVDYDLGEIDPATPANCLSPVPGPGDADGDGVLDADEKTGWMVSIVLGDGDIERYAVSSDPNQFDSDGDGLSDAEERAARTDPRRSDTDSDLLSDYAELNVYKSQPNRVDSDGDSCDPDPLFDLGGCDSDPNLWDGYELALSGTSPTLSDTDGDGISDYVEIHTGGTNPSLADLPSMALELHGDPLIEVQVDYTTGTSTHSEQLAREETDRTRTDTTSTKMSIENTVDIKTHAEAGTSTWPPSFNATIDTETKFQQGYFRNTSSSWKHSSVEQSQDNYQQWTQQNVSFDDGKLSVAMKLVNESDLSFKLKDLRVVAYRQTGGGRFSLIGTMAPDEEWPAEGYVLGPSAELTLTMSKEHIGAEIMRALVSNPSALMFEVGAYSLFQLDEWGVEETVNYAKLGEGVLQRTGLLVIDYGNGRVERHMVATNVHRNSDGSGRGLTLREALADVIGVDYEVMTETLTDDEGNTSEGGKVLFRVRDVKAYDACSEASEAYDAAVDCETLHPQGLWLVGGSSDAFGADSAVDFEDVVLHNGERISLTYLNDEDGDGIFNREEYLLGTNRSEPDTDGDTLGDYAETREGWEVAVNGNTPYEVFPDPRFADVDGDFLSDATEFSLGTDPYLMNTDGDDLADTTDPFPLSPPCLGGDKLGLVAWWDGTDSIGASNVMAEDIWTGDAGGVASDGEMFPQGDNLILDVLGNPAFQFNPLPDQDDQYIDVAAQTDDGLSPHRELSVSARIYWEGVGTGKDWATVLSKGDPGAATYALFVSPGGRLKFTLYRSTYRKCWGWLFGWVDDFCADSIYNGTVELLTDNAIAPQEWVDVTVTFSGETMRLYLNGQLEKTRSTTRTWTSGNLKYRDTTRYLIANGDPLRIGGDFAGAGVVPQWPFRGLADDVQVFGRGLNADEVGQLNQIGICQPTP